MITEEVTDFENEKTLSVHFNKESKLCLTIEDRIDNDYSYSQFIHLQREDCIWIIKRLKQAIKEL